MTATGIRIPRMQARPPMICGSNVMRSNMRMTSFCFCQSNSVVSAAFRRFPSARSVSRSLSSALTNQFPIFQAVERSRSGLCHVLTLSSDLAGQPVYHGLGSARGRGFPLVRPHVIVYHTLVTAGVGLGRAESGARASRGCHSKNSRSKNAGGSETRRGAAQRHQQAVFELGWQGGAAFV